MNNEKKEETTTICSNPNCKKVLYKGELCTCQQDKHNWGNVPTGDKISYVDLPPLKRK